MAKAIVDSWVMAESRDIKRSVEFYSKLGFKPTRRMPYYVEFKVPGGTVLGLHSAGEKKGKKRGGSGLGGWGIMLRVRNIRKLVADLKRKRIRCTQLRWHPAALIFHLSKTRMEIGWCSSSSAGNQ